MPQLGESPVPQRADLGPPAGSGRALPKIWWGAFALMVVAFWQLAVTVQAASVHDYLSGCSTTWDEPWSASAVFGTSALVLSAVCVGLRIHQRRGRLILLASVTTLMCVAGGLYAGLIGLGEGMCGM